MSAEVVRAACPHDFPDTCGMLVTVEDGVATRIQGDPSMPFTDGTLCTKVAYYLERTYSPDRLLYPMRRVAPKGKGQFERITWDAPRRESDRHRSLPQPVCGEVQPAHRPAPGHRRRAGARDDARADRGGHARPRLHRKAHRRL